MSLPSKNKYNATLPVTQGTQGQPAKNFSDYMTAIDALLTALQAGQGPTLKNAANDVAAKAAGVAVGSFYRNGSVVQIRVT